ncbi:MAG: hypothetical protein HPY68_00585 [Candidatus Atribacteria bacterium]|nr:hypothetical protein [Candidatus Atribacteria bacterium]
MEEEAQKFLEAEERATQLVELLEKLYEEVDSYRSAKEELNRVREELVDLIGTLKGVIVGNQEIARILVGINAQDIIQKLIALEDRFQENAQKFSTLEDGLQGMMQTLTALDNRLHEFRTTQERQSDGTLQSLSTLQETLSEARNTITDIFPKIGEINEAVRQHSPRLERIERVERICTGLTTALGKISEGLSQVQRLVLITAGLGFLAVILSFVAIFR